MEGAGFGFSCSAASSVECGRFGDPDHSQVSSFTAARGNTV
jgi:hypothetical protein